MRGRALLLLAGLALAAPSRAAEPAEVAGFAYARAVEVPAAGWVRVPLDEAALRHSAAEEGRLAVDLQVVGPAGEEVERRIEAFEPYGELRPVQVVDVRESPSGDGWVLQLDLGPSPPAHERLLFDFERRVAVADVRVEGSPDARAWQPLAAGDLFRLGGPEGLQRTTVAYPRTALRYLRLTWPRAGGFPEVARVEVEAAAGPVLALGVARPDCRPLGRTGTVCDLRLPAALTVRRLLVEVAGGERVGALGYRLDQAHNDQLWWREQEGVRQAGHGGNLLLTLEPTALWSDLLRLELYGERGRPALAAARVEAAVPVVLFRAPRPGVYTLAYGGLAERPDEGLPAGGAQVSWLEPGPERRLPPPAVPGAAPGEPLPDLRFRSSWRVSPPAAGAGGGGRVVRLELPPAVYARARPDLGDLRLAVGPEGGERQLPFVVWTPNVPAEVPLAVAAAADGGPAEGSGAGARDFAARRVDRRQDPTWTSGISLDLPAPGLPLTQILVTLPPGPFQRPVGLVAQAPGPGEPERPPVTGYVNQACASRPPVPCRAELPIAGGVRAAGGAWAAAAPRLEVRLFDGDDPPLSGLAVEAFRRRDVLVFVWPEEAAAGAAGVRLLAGAPELAAPDYDLARLRVGLLAQPWAPAELGAAETAGGGDGRTGRWLLLGTLALAALALLALLRRVLKEV